MKGYQGLEGAGEKPAAHVGKVTATLKPTTQYTQPPRAVVLSQGARHSTHTHTHTQARRYPSPSPSWSWNMNHPAGHRIAPEGMALDSREPEADAVTLLEGEGERVAEAEGVVLTGMQLVLPMVGVYVPAEHVRQFTVPFPGAYCPILQSKGGMNRSPDGGDARKARRLGGVWHVCTGGGGKGINREIGARFGDPRTRTECMSAIPGRWRNGRVGRGTEQAMPRTIKVRGGGVGPRNATGWAHPHASATTAGPWES
jgi:hypothetical protein